MTSIECTENTELSGAEVERKRCGEQAEACRQGAHRREQLQERRTGASLRTSSRELSSSGHGGHPRRGGGRSYTGGNTSSPSN